MTAPHGERIERDVWLVATVIALGTAGALLSVTSITVALDALSTALGAGLDTTQWTVTGYMLGLAAVVPVTGWLGRRVGAKRLYLVSLALFAVASALCALAPSMGALIALRVLQGVAGGAAIPIGQTILATAAGPGRMGRVMSVVGVPMVLAPVLGPIVGGVLIDGLGWQWIFVVNVPFALVGVPLGARVLPSMPGGSAGPLDIRGFALLTLGAPAIVLGLAETGMAGTVAHPSAAGPLVAGALLIVAFVLHARRVREPLLSIALWRNRGFAACSLATICTGASQFGALVLMPLYVQLAHGADVLETGLLLAPQGIGAALAMPLAGRMTDRVGGGRVTVVGVLVLVVSTAGFALLAHDASLVAFCALALLRGIGQGAAIMPAMAAVFAVLRRDEIPEATPQLSIFQRVGGSIGTAVLTVVLTSHLAGAAPGDAEAVGDAFAVAFWWATAISALALAPALVLVRVEGRRGRRDRGASTSATAKVTPSSSSLSNETATKGLPDDGKH